MAWVTMHAPTEGTGWFTMMQADHEGKRGRWRRPCAYNTGGGHLPRFPCMHSTQGPPLVSTHASNHLRGGGSILFHEMKLGRLLAPGHEVSVGAPSARNMSSSWFISLLPDNQT